MERRLTAKYAQQLGLDAGGWSERLNPDRPALRSQLFLSGLSRLGLQVANVAGHDLALGPEALRALQDSTGVQFVSANIRVNGKPWLPPYVILRRTVNGKTVGIGITGVTMSTHKAFESWPDSLKGSFADVTTSAREVLEVLEPQTDFQILLAYLPAQEVDKLSMALPGYELMVSGAGDLREAPRQGPAPLVVSPGTKCKFLGWLVLRTGPSQSLVVTAAGVDELDARVADDPDMAKRVQEMKHRLGPLPAEAAAARSTRSAVGSAAPPAPPPHAGEAPVTR